VELEHRFDLPVGIDKAWLTLIADRDDRAHTVRIEATGAEGSASTAAMLVTATAQQLSTNRTRVNLVTTVSLTGRPAQFGRVMMVEVGNRLISQFADCVCTKLVGRGTGGAELVDVENPDEIAAERELALSGTAESRNTVGDPEPDVRISVRRTLGSAPELALGGAPASTVLTRVLPALLAVVGAILLRRLFGAR